MGDWETSNAISTITATRIRFDSLSLDKHCHDTPLSVPTTCQIHTEFIKVAIEYVLTSSVVLVPNEILLLRSNFLCHLAVIPTFQLVFKQGLILI